MAPLARARRLRSSATVESPHWISRNLVLAMRVNTSGALVLRLSSSPPSVRKESNDGNFHPILCSAA